MTRSLEKAHNVIEKRYRHSINDRIETLKTLLGGPDSKMSKSVVLRLAIDEIERNRKEIARLQEENHNLKSGQSHSPTETGQPDDSSKLRSILTQPVRSDLSRMLFSVVAVFALCFPINKFVNVSSWGEAMVGGTEPDGYSTGRKLMSDEETEYNTDYLTKVGGFDFLFNFNYKRSLFFIVLYFSDFSKCA